MSNQSITQEQLALMQLKQNQQQLDNDPSAIQADVMREDKTASFLEQLNPDNLMTDIEHRIRGEKKDPLLGWIPIVEGQKPINERLISNFMSFLGAILNQNTSMSNFTPQEINNLMEMIINYVGIDLDVNSEKYEIDGDYPEMWRISIIINSSCFSVLKQAMHGMLSRRIFSVLNVSGKLTEEKKPDWKDALAFWN